MTDRRRAGHPKPEWEISAERWLLGRYVVGLKSAAWLALIVEAVWPALAIVLAAVVLFLIAALLDILPGLPGWLHAAILALGAGVASAVAARRLIRVRAPGWADARRRVETDSGLPHRPLTALQDKLAMQADRETRTLWDAHRAWAERQATGLSVSGPRGIGSRGPLWPGAAMACGLAIAAAAGWEDWDDRIGRALSPQFALAGAASAKPVGLDIWIDPPAYTGKAPIFLSVDPANAIGATGSEAAAPATVSAPVGSTVQVQVTGGASMPQLLLDGDAEPFGRIASGAWRAERILDGGRILSVAQDGREIARWLLSIEPDNAPTVAFVAPPRRTPRAALRTEYLAEDDYGVEDVRLVMTRVTPTRKIEAFDTEQPSEILSIELPVPAGSPAQARAAGYDDLTPHPWAGLPVRMALEVEDALGQIGRSDSLETVLPERVFNHPVARKIVEERKRLIAEPGSRPKVAQEMLKLQLQPSHFYDDFATFLGLRSAMWRALRAKGEDDIAALQELMWRLALRIEDGETSVAARDLRAAQQALMDALTNDDVGDAELQRLMDRMQEALDRFMDAMARESAQYANDPNAAPIDPEAQVLTRRDLQNLLNDMREMSQVGMRDAARQMLERMQDILENLQAGRPSMQQDPRARAALETLQGLEDLVRRQQRLLDESFRESQALRDGGADQPHFQSRPGQEGDRSRRQGRQPGQGGRWPTPGQPQGLQEGRQGAQGGSLAERQEELRRALGEIMRRIGALSGEIPRSFGGAERSMRDAGEALGQGDVGAALPAQTEALDRLRQGMQSLAQQMTRQFGGQDGQDGQGGGPGDAFGRNNRDPLGRRRDGSGMGAAENVDVPDAGELHRARRILDELRRRSADRDRPQLELDYIYRLMDRF